MRYRAATQTGIAAHGHDAGALTAAQSNAFTDFTAGPGLNDSQTLAFKQAALFQQKGGGTIRISEYMCLAYGLDQAANEG
jgi:hypothetical protein